MEDFSDFNQVLVNLMSAENEFRTKAEVSEQNNVFVKF